MEAAGAGRAGGEGGAGEGESGDFLWGEAAGCGSRKKWPHTQ